MEDNIIIWSNILLSLQLPQHLMEKVCQKAEIPELIRDLDNFSVVLGFDCDKCLTLLKVCCDHIMVCTAYGGIELKCVCVSLCV